MRWLTPLAAVVIAACGGAAAPGDPVPPQAPAQAPTAPPAAVPAPTVPSRPAEPLPAASAALPPPTPPAASAPVGGNPPAAGPSWAELWREDWAAPVMGGVVVQPVIDCRGGPADPQAVETWASLAAADTWALFGDRAHVKAGLVSATGGQLVVDSAQDAQAGGWAILSARRFDPAVSLLLEGTIELQPDDGAWISLPLIAGEGDYRQISLRADSGQITADLGAPCYYRPLATFPPGPRRLALEWRPGEGWRYSVDGVLLHTEAASHAGANLAGPPRVGIYVVNVGVESRRLPAGRVRATVGPLRVSTGG